MILKKRHTVLHVLFLRDHRKETQHQNFRGFPFQSSIFLRTCTSFGDQAPSVVCPWNPIFFLAPTSWDGTSTVFAYVHLVWTTHLQPDGRCKKSGPGGNQRTYLSFPLPNLYLYWATTKRREERHQRVEILSSAFLFFPFAASMPCCFLSSACRHPALSGEVFFGTNTRCIGAAIWNFTNNDNSPSSSGQDTDLQLGNIWTIPIFNLFWEFTLCDDISSFLFVQEIPE